MGNVEGGAVEDADGVVLGDFYFAGPGLVGAVDDGGDYGDLGAFYQERDAGLHGEEVGVGAAGAFGEHGEDFAFVDSAEGFFHGGDVGLAAAHGEAVEHF